MKLFYRQTGQGKPFIILHGLYGASDNWLGIARSMQNDFEFFIPDLRNHGQSEHSGEFNYSVLCNDVYEWLSELNIEKPIIMGHSMGGKIAMELVKKYPNDFSALIVLDISPLPYSVHLHNGLLNHKHILRSMLSIDLNAFNKRYDIEKELGTSINDVNLSKFLMKNLSRRPDGGFYWKLNLESLLNNYSAISEGINEINYRCPLPALFIKARSSGYINEQDKKAISMLYPYSKFVEIPKALHWLHIDQPLLLKTEIYTFLTNNTN